MTMSDHNGTHNDDLTQGENPGVQGDIGAGQAEPGPSDPVVVGDGVIEGDEQPRREQDPGADGVEADSGI